MKKFFIFLFSLVFLCNVACNADEKVYQNEIKLDTGALPSTGYKYQVRTQDDEDDELYAKERQQQQLQDDGYDYMYRMHQQMMTPTLHVSPFGGYSY